MEKKMKKEVMTVFLIGMFVMVVSLVSAFGASTPYWDENPLKLAPGESTIIELTLQNMVGEEDIVLEAEITSDGDGIATLVDSNLVYSVPIGTEDVMVPIKVSVPAEVAQGGKKEIVVSFMQVSTAGEGMVSVSGGFTTEIVVEVVTKEESVLFQPIIEQPKTKKEVIPMWGWLLIAVVILAIIFWISRKKLK